MIAECAQDLLTKVQSIPALASSTGLALVGTLPDPGATKLTLPAAWILHKRAKNTRDAAANIALPSTVAQTLLTYVVALYMPTSNLIATQLPLMQAVLKAIHGTTAPSGQRWYWESHDLASFNEDRMIFPMFFSVNAAF